MVVCLMHEIWNQQNNEELPGSFLDPENKSYFSGTVSPQHYVKGNKRRKQGREKAPFRLLKTLIESVIQEISFSLLLALK